MKSILPFILFVGLATCTMAQNNPSTCDAQWAKVRVSNNSDTWKDMNTTCCGPVKWRTTEYSNGDVFKIYRVVKSGLFYVQNIQFDNMAYYKNENDAIRAAFFFHNCSVLTDVGRVKN